MTVTTLNNTRRIEATLNERTASRMPKTPYRALGNAKGSFQAKTVIPEWASKRSVIRAGNATYYVVDAEHLGSARSDLALLESLGWVVEVKHLNLDGAARITMHFPELAQVA